MNKKWIIISSVIAVIVVFGVLTGPVMSDVEKPNYDVVASDQAIEIRHYGPMITAEVEVEGQRKEAISEGFRLLADYIFGNNTVQQKIAMTAPVQQQSSQKIAMTAPVQQQSIGKAWQVSFVMPSEYTMATLPQPNNALVSLQHVPAKKFIVIKFSGTNTKDNVTQYEQQLMDYIKAKQIQVSGSPKYAFYNPPWTLPFLRRNEVMMEVIAQP